MRTISYSSLLCLLIEMPFIFVQPKEMCLSLFLFIKTLQAGISLCFKKLREHFPCIYFTYTLFEIVKRIIIECTHSPLFSSYEYNGFCNPLCQWLSSGLHTLHTCAYTVILTLKHINKKLIEEKRNTRNLGRLRIVECSSLFQPTH